MTLEEALQIDLIREVEAKMDGISLPKRFSSPKAICSYYQGHQTIGGKCIITDGKSFQVSSYGDWAYLGELVDYFRMKDRNDWQPFVRGTQR